MSAIDQAVARLRGMAEIVTGIVFDDNGVADSHGDGGHDLTSTVGWHFGFYSRPNDGARGMVLKADGQGNTSVLVCYRDKQYEMSLGKGECGMQNAFDASILLNSDGEVVINGGTKKVARVDDTAKADTAMATWMGQVESGILGAGGTPPSPIASTFSATSIAKIVTGAAKAKA